MKKTARLLMILIMIISMISSSIVISNGDTVKRYTVLVLDTSDTARFTKGIRTIYTADTAIEYVKDAAKVFAESITSARGENYVAIVSFKENAQIISEFTDDYETLEVKIDSLRSSEDVRNISSGLELADDLISGISDDSAIKNVVLCTTGMTNAGAHSTSGHYNSSTVGSNWYRTDTNIKLYAYANNAYAVAQSLKQKATIYTLGIFQTMDAMPEDGRSVVDFFKLTAKDLASSPDTFHEVDSFDNIIFAFGNIANDITYQAKAGNFRFESGGKDYTDTYYYDDQYFTRDSTNYNGSLATMSLCLAMSAFNSSKGAQSDYSNKFRNVKNLLCDELEFEYFEENQWYSKKPTDDSIGCAIANRLIIDEGEIYTLVVVAVRGGNYEREWASNFVLGESGQAKGFAGAKKQVLTFIKDYIADESHEVEGKIKLWITGYSRAAATSNLVAGAIDDDPSILGSNVTLDRKDLYAYCFETPMGALESDIKDASRYKNIHNIVNKNDLVPRVAMVNFGFTRYGVDHYLPDATTTLNYNAAKEKMLKKYKEIESYTSDRKYTIDNFTVKKISLNRILRREADPIADDWLNQMPQSAYLDKTVNVLADEVVGDRAAYVEEYQEGIKAALNIIQGKWYEYYSFAQIEKYRALFEEKLLDLDTVAEICYHAFNNDEQAIAQLIMDIAEETKRECGMDKITNKMLKDIASVVGKLLMRFVVKHPNMTTTLVMNLGSIGQAHYPELCLAWLKSMDQNYEVTPTEFCGTGSYRIIRINCPVDVKVYDSAKKLVAHIKDDEPQNVGKNGVTAAFNEDGEKIIILPVMEEYSIEMEATDTGEVNYSVSEFNAADGANTRIITYFDIDVEEGDVLKAVAPAYTDNEIQEGTSNGSKAKYTLLDNDGKLIKPDSDLRGMSAREAIYTVAVVSDDEKEGEVIGGGTRQYGSFAQIEAAPYKGYRFEGWYVDDELVSGDMVYRFAVEEDIEVIARFIEEERKGFLGSVYFWIILAALIVIILIAVILFVNLKKKKPVSEEVPFELSSGFFFDDDNIIDEKQIK